MCAKDLGVHESYFENRYLRSGRMSVEPQERGWEGVEKKEMKLHLSLRFLT